jgi:DNA-3-methyladenine glycosylase
VSAAKVPPIEVGVPLPPEFYLQKTEEVARQLLGKGLYVAKGSAPLLLEVTEVEAYLGARDPASHAYRGVTRRNWPMFERGGTCYVYLSYGINYCMNVATQGKGVGEAILFRAGTPLLGVEAMAENRGFSRNAIPMRNLLSGPGKFCQAMGVDLSFNGLTFDADDFKLVDLGKNPPSQNIGTSGRIGISKAKDEPLRFFIKSSPWLSRKG